MFASPSDDQVLALGGLFQAARLVSDLATGDRYDQSALLASALSVVRLEADSVEQVFGGVGDLLLGLNAINLAFSGQLGDRSRPVFQYTVAMHQVGRKLDAFPHMSDVIQQGLEEISSTVDSEGIEDDDASQQALYEDLASLYSKTISTLQPRIMVHGKQGRLENPATVNRVRSALFAGIRSGFLWHQVGGRRWQLLLHRKTYQSRARKIASRPPGRW
jgi:high frequency lysogenization protein